MRILKKVAAALAQETLPALLISNTANIAYVLGTRHAEGTVLFTPERILFFTDGRFVNELKETVSMNQPLLRSRRRGGLTVLPTSVEIVDTRSDFPAVLKKYLKRLRIKRLGIEAKQVSFSSYKKLCSFLNEGKGVSIVPTEDLIEKVRQIKEPHEITLIENSVGISIECFRYIQELSLSHTFSEYTLALEAERFLKLKGEGTAFPPIVAFDRHSAHPHHAPAKKRAPWEQVLLVDIGVRAGNYCSDLTRTYLRDKIPAVKKIYDIVRKAKDLALKQVRTGAKISDIDRAAREYITSKGYGEYFLHALGHGVGINVHELPSINSRNNGYLEENMVFTLEPAVYLDKRFGIRLEDMVRVRGNRGEMLSAEDDQCGLGKKK